LVHYFECLLEILQLDRHCKVIQNLLLSLSWSFKLTFCTSLPIEPFLGLAGSLRSILWWWCIPHRSSYPTPLRVFSPIFNSLLFAKRPHMH
jgi:hypothetical protein